VFICIPLCIISLTEEDNGKPDDTESWVHGLCVRSLWLHRKKSYAYLSKLLQVVNVQAASVHRLLSGPIGAEWVAIIIFSPKPQSLGRVPPRLTQLSAISTFLIRSRGSGNPIIWDGYCCWVSEVTPRQSIYITIERRHHLRVSAIVAK